MARKLVRVTKEHIANGTADDGTCCPVKLAACAVAEVTFVSKTRIEFKHGLMPSIEAPPSVQEFIRKFDAGKKVKPFNFYLNVPSDANV